MKFNKYILATSVLVLNALVASSAAIVQDIQTSSEQSTTSTEQTTQTLEAENTNNTSYENHVTDEEGNYRFELPKNISLEIGKTITAEAFLNGQTAQASTIVQENQNPEPINPNT